MKTIYVALGYPVHNEMSLNSPPPTVLAVSMDEAKLLTFVEGLHDPTKDTLRPGGKSWVYVHEGQCYSSINIVEATNLDDAPSSAQEKVVRRGPICGAPLWPGNVATPLCGEPPGHYPKTLHRGNGSCAHMTWQDPE